MKKLLLFFVVLLAAVTASAENYILYTSKDGELVWPFSTNAFDANIVSNSYEDGQGIILFDGEITGIGGSAFCNCYSLTSVEIPNSVTTIGGWAFFNCSSLTSVQIPNSVTEIGERAFSGCTKLDEIISLNTTPPSFSAYYGYNDIDPFKEVSKETCVVKVPAEAVEAYKAADGWCDFLNIEALDMPEVKICAEPTIEIVDEKIVAKSETEGSTCYISVTSDDFKSVDGEPFVLTGVYTITSYAHAEGYKNSETVSATLVWVMADDLADDVLSMGAKKAVLIRAEGGNIIVSGTKQGESIQVFSLNGQQLASAKANDGVTTLSCIGQRGEIVIVKRGGKSVKIAL